MFSTRFNTKSVILVAKINLLIYSLFWLEFFAQLFSKSRRFPKAEPATSKPSAFRQTLWQKASSKTENAVADRTGRMFLK